jgi:transcriptional antiterminator NusG
MKGGERGTRAEGVGPGREMMPSEASTTKQWFVVHTYSGFENKVAAAIEQRAKIFGLQEQITRIVVPIEEVVEVRKGQKRISSQKFFPGYVLVEMELTDETWHLVRSTPKVTGFVGSGAHPVPLPPGEVEEILRQMEEGAEKPKPKSIFQKGDKVRVVEGPFVNFTGSIDDLNPERGKLKVMVAIFGRLTPVELEYYQVERL